MHFNDPTLRREVKFISNEIFLSKILTWVSTSRLFLTKQFKQRSVNNIYYDTYGYDAYSDNLDGISKRVKLRYRWYGNNRTPNNGAIEIKKRLNALGFKDVYKISLPVNILSHNELKKNIRKNIPKERIPFLDYYSQPIILNCYDRNYFISQCKKIRVTIDTNHKVYDQRFSDRINTTIKANIAQYIVVELKFHPELTEYVSAKIYDIPMRISRNSKYINSVNSIL